MHSIVEKSHLLTGKKTLAVISWPVDQLLIFEINCIYSVYDPSLVVLHDSVVYNLMRFIL